MADKKISQLTPTTTVDLADKYALARGAGNFYLTYETLQNNLTTPTGSFVKTVNGISGDASGNVAVSLASVETGLSSSFPPLPTDGDMYIISGETATDRTASNGQSFIYSSASADWFKLSDQDEAANDARYVNLSGDTMLGDLILSSDPTTALEAATKQYVDGKTAVGTNGQTLRFNGTTLESTSTIFNNGTLVGIGTTTPKAPLHVNSELKVGASTIDRDYIQLLATGDTGSLISPNEHLKIHSSGSSTSKLELKSDVGDIELNAGSNINAKSNRITNVVDPTTTQDAATKGYVDGLATGTAWAGGYLSGGGAYANKYDLTTTFNSNNGNVTWSTANDEWTISGGGTFLISTNGYWQDVNSKTVEIRYSTTAGTAATGGTLLASQAADTTARRWDFFATLTTASTVYLWVHNLSGTGIVRNWKIQIQRLY